jgi:hypothetical protein
VWAGRKVGPHISSAGQGSHSALLFSVTRMNTSPYHGAMNPPSPAMLAIFSASLRLMDDETLAELRGRFVALGEHPAGIHAIDREIAQRKPAAS